MKNAEETNTPSSSEAATTPPAPLTKSKSVKSIKEQFEPSTQSTEATPVQLKKIETGAERAVPDLVASVFPGSSAQQEPSVAAQPPKKRDLTPPAAISGGRLRVSQEKTTVAKSTPEAGDSVPLANGKPSASHQPPARPLPQPPAASAEANSVNPTPPMPTGIPPLPPTTTSSRGGSLRGRGRGRRLGTSSPRDQISQQNDSSDLSTQGQEVLANPLVTPPVLPLDVAALPPAPPAPLSTPEDWPVRRPKKQSSGAASSASGSDSGVAAQKPATVRSILSLAFTEFERPSYADSHRSCACSSQASTLKAPPQVEPQGFFSGWFRNEHANDKKRVAELQSLIKAQTTALGVFNVLRASFIKGSWTQANLLNPILYTELRNSTILFPEYAAADFGTPNPFSLLANQENGIALIDALREKANGAAIGTSPEELEYEKTPELTFT